MLPSVMVGDKAGMVKFCAARLAAAKLKAALNIGQIGHREKDLSLGGSEGWELTATAMSADDGSSEPARAGKGDHCHYEY
jgi:hypothetical protein